MSRVAESFHAPPWASTRRGALVPDLSGVDEDAVEVEHDREARLAARFAVAHHAARTSGSPAGAVSGRVEHARIAGEDSAPARHVTKTWRRGGMPVSGDGHDARAGVAVREPWDERDAQPTGDEPHRRLPVRRPVRDLGLKPAVRQPATNTSSHDQPTAARPTGRRSLRELDPRAAGQRVVGGQDRVEDVAEQLLAVEAGVVAVRRRGALMPRIRSTSRATSIATAFGRLGLLDPQRHRGRDGAQRACGRGQQTRSAVGKPATRTSPRGDASCAARSPCSFSSWANSASAWPTGRARRA